MKSSHLALVTLVLGLGLGFAAGAVFRSSPNAGSHSGALPTTLAADRSDAPFGAGTKQNQALANVEARAATSTTSSPLIVQAAATSPEAKRLARESIQFASSAATGDGTEDQATWTHSIHGTVIDQDGQPLPGVQIVSFNRVSNAWRGVMKGRKTATIGRAWEGVPDAESKTAENAERMLEDERNHRTAVSDATGRFTLTGLREGLHSVKAYADGFAFSAQSTHTAQECAFVGERVLELELDVRLPDGSQPENAVVFTGDRNFGSEYAWTPDEPRLRLKEAAFELTVRSGSVQRVDWRNTASDYSSEPRPINLEAEGPGPHVVQLAMNQILRVKLEDASDLVPKLPVWMKVASATVEAAAGPGEIDWSEERHSELTLAPSGTFQIMDLPKGTYWLAAGRGAAGSDPQVTTKFEIDAGVTEESIVLSEVDLTQFVVCHCVRSEGGSVSGVSFEVGRDGEKRYRSTRIDAVARARGEYWLPRGALFPETPGESAGEEAELIGRSEIDGQVSVSIDRGSEEVTLTFLPVCTLNLEIGGDVSAGYTVYANRLAAGGKPTVQYISSLTAGTKKVPEGGLVSIMGLQPGDYEIDIYESGHGTDGIGFMRRSDRIMSESVEVSRAESTVRLTLPTFQKLVIHAPDIQAGEKFRLSRSGGQSIGRGASAVVDENSLAVFDRVASGQYSLQGPQRKEPMEITVPTGDIQWIAEIINAARVRSVEANGPADQAGFKRNDLVIALDGVPVKGKLEYRKLREQVAEKSVRFTILRGGETLDLALGPLAAAEGKPASTGFSTTPHTLSADDQ